jgi:TolB-like protein
MNMILNSQLVICIFSRRGWSHGRRWIAAAVLVVAACANASAQEEHPAGKPTVAVLTFDVQQGVTKPEAQILADRLAIEIGRTGRFTLINRQRMADQLALQKFSHLDTCSASECAVEAGRILNATHMVYGSIGKIGGTFSLNTYLISVESGATIQSVSTDITGGIEEMLTQGIAVNATRLATLTGAGSRAAAASKPTCAVLTFDSRGGVSLDEVRLFSDRFAIELDGIRQYTLVPRSKMEEVLREQQFARSENCSAAECAIEAGKLLGVRYMAFGSMGMIGSLYTINTYLVDVESGVAVKTATTDFSGDKESVLTRGMRENAMTLLGVKAQQGYLSIRVDPAHAALLVDGNPSTAGRIPVPSGTPVTVTVQADGYSPRTQTHLVKAGETLDVDVRLSRSYTPQTPIQPRWEAPAEKAKPPSRPRVH